MTNTTRIRITTTDTAFATRYGTGLDSNSDTVINVPTDKIERVTFAGRDMIRFDMRLVARTLPRDWANRYTMYPATRIEA